jgi:DNA-binding GntR family transcriptional regulator
MEQAYIEIKRRIITLELAPGQRIDDYELSVELEFSRTPIREAILRLAAEGLVDMRTKGGCIVRPIDLIDITHLFEAHVVLAKAVARLAARRVTPAELERMASVAAQIRAAIERRDYLAITSSNAQLHRLEAAAAHNQNLQSMADSIHDQAQRLSYVCFGGAGGDRGADLDEHFRKVCGHHDAMRAALAAHDADAAETIATEHVRLFRERVKAFLDTDALGGFELSDADLAGVSFSGS